MQQHEYSLYISSQELFNNAHMSYLNHESRTTAYEMLEKKYSIHYYK